MVKTERIILQVFMIQMYTLLREIITTTWLPVVATEFCSFLYSAYITVLFI